jgi:hypothetical protein
MKSHPRQSRAASLPAVVIGLLALAVAPVHASESTMDDEPAPESVEDLGGPLGDAFRVRLRAGTLFPRLAEALEDRPPFLRDTRLLLAPRTYYFRRRNEDGSHSEAWALGGSLSYESGWWREFFSVGGALYTSQRLVGSKSRDGTGLLAPRQHGYNALGQAYARLRWREHLATLYRQALDLPYVNGQDSRMTPNTFEGFVATGSEGPVDYAAGHLLRMKRRNEEGFDSFSKVAGVPGGGHEGLSLLGVRVRPLEGLSLGAIDHFVKDTLNILYAEADWHHEISEELGVRVQGQWTHQASVGDHDLTGRAFHTWVSGGRVAASFRSAILTLAFSTTDSEATIRSPFGSYAGYVSLMQEDFDRASEDAFGVGASFHFRRLGLPGLSAHGLAAWGRDAKDPATRQSLPDQRELDATLDYRFEDGVLRGLWLRLRFSNVDIEDSSRDSNELRFIVNYELPVL